MSNWQSSSALPCTPGSRVASWIFSTYIHTVLIRSCDNAAYIAQDYLSWTVSKSYLSSPPARWGLLDFMSVASSSSSSSSFSSLFSSSFSSSSPLFSSPLLVSSPRLLSSCSLPDLNHDHPRQCALPDLNHDHPRPVFPAGPQPRVSPPSVPCRTSTTTIHAQCSLPDLNREYPRQKICHIECQKICQIEC